jgi:outer membrane protein assembly factor BamB
MDFNDPKPKDGNGARALYDCAKGAAFVSAVAIAVILILFLVAWLHVKDRPPTDGEAMKLLIEAAKADPGNTKLVKELRSLDVVARQAQFQWFHFSKRGGLLLAIGVACLFASLKLMGSLRRRLPKPGAEAVSDDRTIARWSVLGGMVILVLFFFVFMKKGIPTFKDAVADKPTDPIGPGTDELEKRTLASVAELEANWTAFLGHSGSAVAPSETLPKEWDGPSGKGLLWKTKLPFNGFNSPIVWKNRLYCTGANPATRVIYCLDINTGSIVWEINVKPMLKPTKADISDDTGFAAATMACNGGYVYAIFGGGELVCLDLEGTVVWQKRFGFPTISYGYSSSIRCFRDRVILQQDYAPHHRVIALDAHTGAVVWQTPRIKLMEADSGEDMQECWSTPTMVLKDDKPLLVLNGNPEVRAYDPVTGDRLWGWNGMGGEVATSIAIAGDKLLVSQEYAMTAVLNLTDGKLLWESDELDAPDVCSPIAVGDLAFLPSNGPLTCVSLTDGKVKWTHEYEEGFYASPVAAGNRILLIDRKGHAVVLKATDTYTEVSTHTLGEKCVATPAVVGGRLYIRGKEHIFCFGK